MIEPFPLIEVWGPPRERGRQYGRQAATRIARGVEHYAAQLRSDAVDWLAIRGLVQDYLPHIESFDPALFDDFATPWSVCRPPRPSLNGTMTATVAMIMMEPALGLMEIAPLPALNRAFTTYRLEAGRPATAAVAG